MVSSNVLIFHRVIESTSTDDVHQLGFLVIMNRLIARYCNHIIRERGRREQVKRSWSKSKTRTQMPVILLANVGKCQFDWSKKVDHPDRVYVNGMRIRAKKVTIG